MPKSKNIFRPTGKLKLVLPAKPNKPSRDPALYHRSCVPVGYNLEDNGEGHLQKTVTQWPVGALVLTSAGRFYNGYNKYDDEPGKKHAVPG